MMDRSRSTRVRSVPCHRLEGDTVRTIAAFIRALRQLAGDDGFRALAGFAAGLLATGTVFYILVEHWTLLDALYFCVVTLATVGYGDLYPTTDLGKAFTIVYILTGVGILVAFASRVVDTMITDREERRRGQPGGAGTVAGPPAVALGPGARSDYH